MEQVRLTQLQANTLDGLLLEDKKADIVRKFVQEEYTVVSPIYDLSTDTLIRALYYGYYL